jgi:hypothetical protein
VDDLGESVWCLVDIEVSSAKTVMCDWGQSGVTRIDINKSAIIKRRVDINTSAKLQGT